MEPAKYVHGGEGTLVEDDVVVAVAAIVDDAERKGVLTWYARVACVSVLAVGVPKALGSAVGGIVLSACIRWDPNASNYLVGAVPHAVLVAGALGLLVLHERNERDYGHESLYVPPPAKAKVEARAPAKGVTEQVAHSY